MASASGPPLLSTARTVRSFTPGANRAYRSETVHPSRSRFFRTSSQARPASYGLSVTMPSKLPEPTTMVPTVAARTRMLMMTITMIYERMNDPLLFPRKDDGDPLLDASARQIRPGVQHDRGAFLCKAGRCRERHPDRE